VPHCEQEGRRWVAEASAPPGDVVQAPSVVFRMQIPGKLGPGYLVGMAPQNSATQRANVAHRGIGLKHHDDVMVGLVPRSGTANRCVPQVSRPPAVAQREEAQRGNTNDNLFPLTESLGPPQRRN
jgi:hypothetical protein